LRAIIFANGELNHPESAGALIRDGDFIIAADGGSHHCARLGITPHLVVGDFDSIKQSELNTLEASGARLVRYDPRKDYTDLELALEHARQNGATQALVFGALGARWDQTLANLLLPAARTLSGLEIRLLDGEQEITLLRGGETCRLEGLPGDTLSLIPLTLEARGVLTQGLEYPLRRETLYLGATRGVSNVLVERQASVSLEEGLLICVLSRQEYTDQNEVYDET
jgi:thiamine pyrophosphokinase